MVNVEATLKNLLQREDTDQNMQITIEDQGPKVRCDAASLMSGTICSLASTGDLDWYGRVCRL